MSICLFSLFILDVLWWGQVEHLTKGKKLITYLFTYLFTYLLTPWCRILLEKLTGLQLVKKFPAFHGTRRFITAFTSVRYLSLSWASPIQSIYPHPTSWRSILILSTHLRLGLPSGLLPSCFPTKTLYTPSTLPYVPHAQPISLLVCLEFQFRNLRHILNYYFKKMFVLFIKKTRIRMAWAI